MSLGRRLAGLTSSAVLLASLMPTTRADNGLATARVALDVRWGAGGGSDEFRDEMQRVLSERLALTCFSSVPVAPADSELTLTVVLSELREDVRYDDSIAGTLNPGTPEATLQRAAHCQVTTDTALTATATGAQVIRKRFTTSIARHPMVIGEDPQVDARAEVVNSASRQIAKSLGCGGAKLAKKIQDALSHGTGAPASR